MSISIYVLSKYLVTAAADALEPVAEPEVRAGFGFKRSGLL